jgi:hypothetical protein
MGQIVRKSLSDNGQTVNGNSGKIFPITGYKLKNDHPVLWPVFVPYSVAKQGQPKRLGVYLGVCEKKELQKMLL